MVLSSARIITLATLTGVVVAYMMIISLLGCSSKAREGTVEFGLQSCFTLKVGETVVTADTYVEKYYLSNCAIQGASFAINRVIHTSEDDYTLICMATDVKFTEIPDLIAADTSFKQGQLSQANIEIAKKKTECRTAFGYRNGYWLYYCMFMNERIGRPFVIIIPSKKKEIAEAYFSSPALIQERLNCETN